MTYKFYDEIGTCLSTQEFDSEEEAYEFAQSAFTKPVTYKEAES